jgi:FKBP-type peptidyl-prolyl cis-trans isomerase 2
LIVSKGDILLLELEGKDAEGNIFDSTSGEIAKTLHGKEGPLLLSFGFDRIIPGIYEALAKMDKGQEKELSLSPEKAFGQRKKGLVKIMSFAEFKKYKVKPEPGLRIHVDTEKGRSYGTVKSVSGGRVMVDFNHPLAGQDVSYKIKLVDLFTDIESKVRAICSDSGIVEKWELKGDTLNLKFKEHEGAEFESRKALTLLMLKTRVQGLKKIDIGAAMPAEEKQKKG